MESHLAAKQPRADPPGQHIKGPSQSFKLLEFGLIDLCSNRTSLQVQLALIDEREGLEEPLDLSYESPLLGEQRRLGALTPLAMRQVYAPY